MRRIGVRAGLAAAALVCVVVAGGCDSTSAPHTRLVVFAAASLRSAFTQIGERFKADNPGTDVEFDFAGSSELATPIDPGRYRRRLRLGGHRADGCRHQSRAACRCADEFRVEHAGDCHRPGNPKHIASFADLGRPGLSVVICQRPVPCGSAAHRVEDATGTRLNPVSEEPSVSDVLNKVTTGQADAALVYVTDARSAANNVTTVGFPEAAGAVNVYPIAVLKNAPHAALAGKFVAGVGAESGQQILDQAGFARP